MHHDVRGRQIEVGDIVYHTSPHKPYIVTDLTTGPAIGTVHYVLKQTGQDLTVPKLRVIGSRRLNSYYYSYISGKMVIHNPSRTIVAGHVSDRSLEVLFNLGKTERAAYAHYQREMDKLPWGERYDARNRLSQPWEHQREIYQDIFDKIIKEGLYVGRKG